MSNHGFGIGVSLVALVTVGGCARAPGDDPAREDDGARDAAAPPVEGSPSAYAVNAQRIRARMDARITLADRLAAAARAEARRRQADLAGPGEPVHAALAATAAPAQGGAPNYFGPEPNWANSPIIRKFIDSLPGLTAAGANNLGQYLPVAIPDATSYPGADYYEIELGQYTEKMHTDLQPTTLRGYRQANTTDATVSRFHYLGPLIVAQKGRPVRIKFTNRLPTGAGGALFLPVDTTAMGAGMGPKEMAVTPGYPMNYTENRGTLHLHGGLTPWISDGTQHQWITPAGERTDYPRGVSVQNVPDMPDPGDGSATFYYANQQSARLMFYHDHAFGITRLNVYAGEAAGYLLTDSVEQDLITRGILPDVGTPLIIQDKTFIDPTKVLTTDPTWPFAIDATRSNLWQPHVYMPNQNYNDLAGVNHLGRWDYGPWFWPPWPVTNQPLTLADGTLWPNLPNLSMTMESFMDTPLVNGTAYPYFAVQPKAYRFRVLNAANDRFWNLQLLQADPAAPTEVRMVSFDSLTAWPAGWPTPDARAGGIPDPATLGPSMIQIGTEGGFLPAPVVWGNVPIGYDRDTRSVTVGNVLEHNLLLGPAERADVIVDFSAFAGRTLILYNDAPAAVPATDVRYDYYTGNPNLTAVGGAPSTLAGFGPNTRTIMQIRVATGTPQPFNLAALNAEFASTATRPGVFARGQDPILVPQAGYNSAYNGSFPADTRAYERIASTSLTFTPLGGTAPLTIVNQPKAIAELFNNDWGRMSAMLGVELRFTNGGNQTTLDFRIQDPATEILDDAVTVGPVAPGDGTQLWKITHNGVDTHPIHFHLFNVQVVNRVDWAGVVKPPEPNELGWKETVRMNPLEDVIVALRPVAAKAPFGQPDSIRPLDPTMPLGSTAGFRGLDPATGAPITVVNQLVNLAWEYVWHCHILSHEEMDMMRPMQLNVSRTLPAAPVLQAAGAPGSTITLTWTDGTPVSDPATLGNPANEIGFRIERAAGAAGAFAAIGTALANATTFTDGTTTATETYRYRVVAYNAAGESPSSTVTLAPTLPVALVQSASTVGSNVTSASVAFTGANSAGNLIIAAVRASTTTQTVTVTDSRGNAYAEAVGQTQTTDGHQLHIYYARNIAAGANTVRAAFSGSNRRAWLAIFEYRGLSTTTPLDRTARGQGSGTAVSSGATATTTSPYELVFAAVGVPAGSTATITGGSGFTILQRSSGAGGTEAATVAAAGAYTGTFTLSAAANWSAVTATFAAAGQAPPPPPPVAITTTSLPGATVGVAYSATLAAGGGTAPYTWAVTAGALPAGLTLA
ncbi:MAG TPA: putative Ig domain-containing protein, partial [Polyangia bacterium]